MKETVGAPARSPRTSRQIASKAPFSILTRRHNGVRHFDAPLLVKAEIVDGVVGPAELGRHVAWTRRDMQNRISSCYEVATIAIELPSLVGADGLESVLQLGDGSVASCHCHYRLSYSLQPFAEGRDVLQTSAARGG